MSPDRPERLRTPRVGHAYISGHALVGAPPEHRDWKDGDPSFYPEIHPTARINAFVSVDAGLKGPTRVGARTLVMKHCHLGHDAQIGDDCELAPGTVVGGHVRIGDRVRVGVNASFRPFVTVGDDARIGAGAVVVNDVPPGETWAGNPAKRLASKPDSARDDTYPDYVAGRRP